MFPACFLPYRIPIQVFDVHAKLCGNEAKDALGNGLPPPPEFAPDTGRRRAGSRSPAGCVHRAATGSARCRRRTACNGAAARLRPWEGRTAPRAGARSRCFVSACSVSTLSSGLSGGFCRRGAVRKGYVQRTAHWAAPIPAKPVAIVSPYQWYANYCTSGTLSVHFLS